MFEYYSEAVVLDASPVGEADTRFALFTKRFGKLVARGRSARKITSKLSAHLQIGNVIAVRVVEKNGLRVADAVKKLRLTHAPADLSALSRLTHEGERDVGLWNALLTKRFSWLAVLKHLGYDPAHAACALCSRTSPEHFSVARQEFVCTSCLRTLDASKTAQSEVVLVA